MFNCYLIRYGEIFLKGSNRGFFERKLIYNIKNKIKEKVVKKGRRIIIYTEKKLEELNWIFGIVSYSRAIECGADIKEIKHNVAQLYKRGSFRISANREDKKFNYSSQEINEIIGSYIVKEFKAKVKLKDPRNDIGIDILDNKAYVFNEGAKGLCGLPVGVSGKVNMLLSGGIDSAVASFLLMKRGCKVNFTHFYHNKADKILNLTHMLSRYQGKSKLYLIDFNEVEREIIKVVPARLRIIVLKRMFLKVSEKINNEVIATGENLAQVSSQTKENLEVIEEAGKRLILRPLLCYDKQEIIDLAKKIGTYDISIQAYNDCCNLLITKHPETRARLDEILEIEKNFNFKLLDDIKVEVVNV